jgi:hypothetical protein
MGTLRPTRKEKKDVFFCSPAQARLKFFDSDESIDVLIVLLKENASLFEYFP